MVEFVVTKTIICLMTINTLSDYKETPSTLLRKQFKTCTKVIDESVRQGEQDRIPLFLAIAWQESRFHEEAVGKRLCTNRGKLVKYKVRKKTKYKCIPKPDKKSTLTRARGPMQILPVYHCPKGERGKCDYLKESIELLSSNLETYGHEKGIMVYAGGLQNIEKNKVARAYARRSMRREKTLNSFVKKAVTWAGWAAKLLK